ncbi:class I SAM-dependent methyltransferase [Gimesia sp.]|uniref:class I SAM-dependent methyltransferase n=1 Tax=Gimesia sp. TaxID=2024833 RepID=UPI000C37999E|nr:class I SAM-dependent methyltransferase [Gimesia sp.]MAX35711.1 hypothetical protein [Gimesia sp.]HAH45357.1 hypothetical protein [Planctomycetaceae bacterium]
MVDCRKSDFYDAKYAEGGFVYNEQRERDWLKKHLVDRFNLQPGDKLLEVGCGKGLHSSLLADQGLDVYGVDISRVGIEAAQERGSQAHFIAASASDLPLYFDHGYFDVIFARGMSWYHYELDREMKLGVDPRIETAKFFRFLKPGGLFVLQIKTDFSGSRPAGDVHHNRLSDYRGLFEPLGDIVHVSNMAGVELIDDNQAAEVKGGVVIATRK